MDTGTQPNPSWFCYLFYSDGDMFLVFLYKNSYCCYILSLNSAFLKEPHTHLSYHLLHITAYPAFQPVSRTESVLVPFPLPSHSLADLHYRHDCEWSRAGPTQSVQTGRQYSMAAGWNSSSCSGPVTTQRVASPPLPLSVRRHCRVFCSVFSCGPVSLGLFCWCLFFKMAQQKKCKRKNSKSFQPTL